LRPGLARSFKEGISLIGQPISSRRETRGRANFPLSRRMKAGHPKPDFGIRIAGLATELAARLMARLME
jgi:hypothetical protein